MENPLVATVSPDGLLQAVGLGRTQLTIINHGAEVLVPVVVETPLPGNVTLDERGGTVSANDGAVLQIPPRALTESASVSIIPYTEVNLPFALPEHLDFVAGYDLQLGVSELAQPVQLMFPVPAGTPAGEKVYLYSAESLPKESGGMMNAWIAV